MSRPAACHDQQAPLRPLRSALVVATHPEVRDGLLRELRSRGIRGVEAHSASQARTILGGGDFDLVICDDQLGPESGLDLLAELRERRPGVARVLVTMQESVSRVREAVNCAGVSYLLPALWDAAAIDAALHATAPQDAGAQRGERGGPSSPHASGIIGESPAIRELLDLVGLVADTDSTVLVTGETGSGKELVGRAIHEASRRRTRLFSAVNSAAFPESLLESELFGHTRGSFTGATGNKKGLFEVADKGTVLLDEVAEMPLSMQAKLLRFLQTGEIRPIGSESTRFVDVRLVAATNKDLLREVERGTFREDLYYRLAVIPLQVPPLRERASDVPLLARHFVRRFGERTGRPPQRLDPCAIDALISHDWPGNVRELENVMERAVALCRNGTIGVEDLPPLHRARGARSSGSAVESLPVLERRHIIETLERVGWNRKRAAELLQISTTTLWRRLKEFGVEGKPPREPTHADRVAARGPGGS